MQSDTTAPTDSYTELRGERRYGSGEIRVGPPLNGAAVNCSLAGLCIETSEAPPVGVTWPIAVHTKGKRLLLTGSFRWARLTRTERLESGEVRPVYSVGIALMDGAAIETWRHALLRCARRLETAASRRLGRIVIRFPAAH